MKKSAIRVSSKDYQSEITCRWDIMCANDPDLMANSRENPRPRQWKLTKLQMWPDNNRVTNDSERAFFLAAVDERIGASASEEKEEQEISLLNECTTTPTEVKPITIFLSLFVMSLLVV